MSTHHLNLSLLDDDSAEVPEAVQRVGQETVQIIWQTAYDKVYKEALHIQENFLFKEKEAQAQVQKAFAHVEDCKIEIKRLKEIVERLTRENQSLHVEHNRKIGEIKTLQSQNGELEDKAAQKELEVRKLQENIGRVSEKYEIAQKRIYELIHQAEQDRVSLKEAQETAAVNARLRERTDKNLQENRLELDQTWKQLKQEQTKTAVAEALTQEFKERCGYFENIITHLKEEEKILKDRIEADTKQLGDAEKKLLIAGTRMESQEHMHQQTITRLENELEQANLEANNLRARMIKTEGALEREKKAMERLETKLVAAAGNQSV